MLFNLISILLLSVLSSSRIDEFRLSSLSIADWAIELIYDAFLLFG